MGESSRGRRRRRNPFDYASQRLRELERAIDGGAGGDAGQFLPPVARALLLIRRSNTVALDADGLFERLELWAERRAPGASKSLLRKAVDGAIARPYLDKADALARRLGLTYAARQRLLIRTIGACDVSKRGRAELAKRRKRKRERARIAAKRRAAGAVPREEFLARSLTRAQPWVDSGVSRRTWYRRLAAAGTGALPAGTRALPSTMPVADTGVSPDISSTAQQPTGANDVLRPAPARRTGNRRALPAHGEPPVLTGNGGRRSASPPSSSVGRKIRRRKPRSDGRAVPPAGACWVSNVIYLDLKAGGRHYRRSLGTNDVAVAAQRVAVFREQIVADVYYGGAGRPGPRGVAPADERGGRPAAPDRCYWRGGVFWTDKRIRGVLYQRSLRTADPMIAAERRNWVHEQLVADHATAPSQSGRLDRAEFSAPVASPARARGSMRAGRKKTRAAQS